LLQLLVRKIKEKCRALAFLSQRQKKTER